MARIHRTESGLPDRWRPAAAARVVLACALAAFSTPSCSRDESADRGPKAAEASVAKRVATAEEGLRTMRSNMRKHWTNSEGQRYLDSSLETALANLADPARRELRKPMMVTAEFLQGPLGNSLSLIWLESEPLVTGVYVIDEAGTRKSYPGLFEWTAGDAEWYAGTAQRSTWVPLQATGDTAAGPTKSRWPPIALDPASLRGTPRVGLLLQAGETEPIVAHVATELRQW